MLSGTGTDSPAAPGKAERLRFPQTCHGSPATRVAAARRPSSPTPFLGALPAGAVPSVTPSRGSDPGAEQPRECVTVQMSRFRPLGWKSQSPRAAKPERAGKARYAGREGDWERGLPAWEGVCCRSAGRLLTGAASAETSPYGDRKRLLLPRKRVPRSSGRGWSGVRAAGAGARHKMAAEAVAPRRRCLPPLPADFSAEAAAGRGCRSQHPSWASWGWPIRATLSLRARAARGRWESPL